MAQFLLKSRAQSTIKRYTAEIIKFKKWCSTNHIEKAIPTTIPIAATYIHNRFISSRSPSVTVAAHAALKWLHSLIPKIIHNPFDSSICRNILESVKRSKTSPIKKKLPISPDMVHEILDLYTKPEANLAHLRTACMVVLGFTGFLRYSELSNIRVHHIERHETYIKILIPESKTDIYREENYIFIHKLYNKYCPVSILDRYLQAARTEPNSTNYHFRRLKWHKSINQQKLSGTTKPSYSTCRDMFKECLTKLGFDPASYGLHSLRAGGATAAVRNNPNISERMLKLHGRWKSSTAKDMYIQEGLKERLTISKQLGL